MFHRFRQHWQRFRPRHHRRHRYDNQPFKSRDFEHDKLHLKAPESVDYSCNNTDFFDCAEERVVGLLQRRPEVHALDKDIDKLRTKFIRSNDPLDGMTASKLSRRWHYLRYSINNRLMYYNLVDPYKHGRGLRSVYINFFHKVVSSKWIHERMDKVQKQYDYSSSALIADHDNKPSRGILPREVYGKPTLVSFEGHKFYGVQNPNAYLKYCYGDYMKMPGKLPPQNFRYLNMRLPYNEYLKKKK